MDKLTIIMNCILLLIMTIKCTWSEPSIICGKQDHQYACNFLDFNTSSPDFKFPTKPQHAQGFINEDVEIINKTAIQRITKFPLEIFDLFKKVRTIELTYVYMEELDENFYNCVKLENLDLQHNNLTTLSSRILRNCTSLINIYLGFNKISTIAEDAFYGLPLIEEILFDNNILDTIPENLLFETSSLYVFRLNVNFLSSIPNNLLKNNHWLQYFPMENNPTLNGILPDYFFVNHKVLKDLWIENINLVDFPMGYFANTTELFQLFVKDNKIRRIKSGVFHGLLKLERLELQNNVIKNIENNAFSSLGKLTILYLGNNLLKFLNSKVFSPLVSLKAMNIKNNPILSISYNFFDHLPNLRYLYFRNVSCVTNYDDNFKTSLSSCFSNILQCKFGFHEDYGYSCNIIDSRRSNQYPVVIDNVDQEAEVTHVSSRVNMTEIPVEIFKIFGSIKIADFSGIGLTDNGLSGMSNCRSYCDNVDILILDNNEFRSIPDDIKNFKNFQKLSMTKNRISQIYTTTFSNITNASFLNVSGNEILYVQHFSPFKYVDISNNPLIFASKITDEVEILNINYFLGPSIMSMIPDAFETSPKLKKLLMSNRKLVSLENFQFNGILEILDLSHNQIMNANFSEIPGLENLKILNFSNNFLDQIYFEGLDNLEFLELSKNKISLIENLVFKKLIKLTELYINKNSIQTIKHKSFFGLENLEILSLFSNQISFIESQAFTHLKNLRFLDLSGNQFAGNLHSAIFVNLQKLEVLKIQYSNLKTLPSSISILKNLIYLNLANNSLKSILFQSISINLNILDISSNQISTMNPKLLITMNETSTIFGYFNPCYGISQNPFESCGSNFKNLNYCEYEQIEKIGLTCRISNLTKNSQRKSEVRYLYNKNKPLEVEVYTIFEIYENLTNVELWKSSVTDINGIKNCKNLKNFDLRFNLIENLHSFSDCKNLEKLILTKNKIFNVDVNAFKGLKILKLLDLSFNDIQNLESGTFNENLELERLLLGYNRISIINFGLFSNLVNLKVLKFSNNLLTEIIDPNTFENQSNLLEIHLNSNKLAQIHKNIFVKFKKLKYLNLEKNQISKIDLSSMSSKYFSYFDISFNNATEILIDFGKLPNLRSFFGRGNFCINENFEVMDKNKANMKLRDCKSIPNIEKKVEL